VAELVHAILPRETHFEWRYKGQSTNFVMIDTGTANRSDELISRLSVGTLLLALGTAGVMVVSAWALASGLPVASLSAGLLAAVVLCWTSPRLRLGLLFLASIPSYFYSITAWGSPGQDYTVEFSMVIPWVLLIASLREMRLPIGGPLAFFTALAFMGLLSGLVAIAIRDPGYFFPILRALISYSTYLVILTLLYSLWRKTGSLEEPLRWITWFLLGISCAVILQFVLYLLGFDVLWGLFPEHNFKSRVPFLPFRSGGWVGSPEDVGVLTGFLFPLAHHYLGLTGSRKKQALFSILVLAALLAGQSRTGLGFFLIYFLIVVLLNPSLRRRVGAAAGGLTAAVIFFLALQHTDLLTENIAHQLYWRGDAQAGGMQILLHSPSNFFFGIGPSYGILSRDTSLRGIDLGRKVVLARNSASSDFINTWLFAGLGGLLILLSLWAWTFRFLVAKRSQLGSSLFTALLSMGLGLLLSSLISETLSRPFLGMTAVSFAFFFYFAYLGLLRRLTRAGEVLTNSATSQI